MSDGQSNGNKKPRNHLWSFKELMIEPEAPIPWLVEPIITMGDRALFYGEWGSLKTWLLMSLALCLAAGYPWVGHFPVKQRFRVLYIDEEMNRRRFKKRLKQLAEGMGIALEDDLAIRLLSRPGLKFDDPAKTRMWLATVVKEFEPDVIIIESLRRVLKGSENDAEAIARFWEAVDPLVADEHRTVIVSHHMRKPRSKSEGTRHRASGNTDIQAGADDSFSLERSGNSVVIAQIKNREGDEYPPFEVTMEGDGEEPVVLSYSGKERVDPSESDTLVNQLRTAIQEYLRSTPGQKGLFGMIQGHLQKTGYKFGRRTLQRALGELVNEKILDSPRKGEYVLLPPRA